MGGGPEIVATHGDLGAINPKSAQPRAMLGKRLRQDARVQDPSDIIEGRKSGWDNRSWLWSAAPQQRDAFLTLYRTFGLCVEPPQKANFEF